jgi:hypothetical protein
MKLRRLIGIAALMALPLTAQISKEDKAAGFTPLFNGKDLSEWDGDPNLWKVEGGVIIGSTDGVEIKQNTFLIHKKPVSNFHLKVQVKLRNGNSGIQFRSTAMPGYVVHGLQADMAAGNWWGSIYDEKGTRGVIVNGWKGKAETVVKAGDWNDFEVKADGENIEISVNGLQTATLKDSFKLEGVLALQLHRGPGMQVEFRNLRIKTWK